MGWERHLLIGCADRTEQEKAWAEIKHLRAIVDTFPKCYRLVDGKPVQDCPAAFETQVWAEWNDMIFRWKITRMDTDGWCWLKRQEPCDSPDSPEMGTKHFANSREAAEVMAAKGKETKE